MAVKLSEMLYGLIDLCDEQYIKLESTLTKPWIKHFISSYGRLFNAENTERAKDFNFTSQFKPLFDLLLERLKLQGQNQYVSLSSKVLVKLD